MYYKVDLYLTEEQEEEHSPAFSIWLQRETVLWYRLVCEDVPKKFWLADPFLSAAVAAMIRGNVSFVFLAVVHYKQEQTRLRCIFLPELFF